MPQMAFLGLGFVSDEVKFFLLPHRKVTFHLPVSLWGVGVLLEGLIRVCLVFLCPCTNRSAGKDTLWFF